MLKVASDRSQKPTSEREVMVARQPIYNDRMGVYGYELLFRAASNNAGDVAPAKATAQVLGTTLLNFGLEELVLHRRAVINVTRAFLDVMSDIQLPTEQLILDIPDDITVDEGLVEKLKELGERGYGLCAGGLANLRALQQVLPYIDMFRLDVRQINDKQLDLLIGFLRQHENLSLRAIKIETMEEYRFYRERGFDYLQGFFMSRPREYVSSDLPANKLAILQLLTVIHNPDTSTNELEQHIIRDVTLSYKLLKLVNAPFFGVARKVDSIKHAIVLLGRDEIRKLVSLLALGGLNDVPMAVMEIAMLRAKTCELLAQEANLPQDSHFTVGMLSVLDILLQQSIGNILTKLPLSDSVKNAILKHEGSMGRALSCAIALDKGDWRDTEFEGLGSKAMHDAYRGAIQWTYQLIQTL